jgi:hypothetical protein
MWLLMCSTRKGAAKYFTLAVARRFLSPCFYLPYTAQHRRTQKTHRRSGRVLPQGHEPVVRLMCVAERSLPLWSHCEARVCFRSWNRSPGEVSKVRATGPAASRRNLCFGLAQNLILRIFGVPYSIPQITTACPAGTPWARNGSSPWYGPFWAQASTFLSCWFACSSDSPVQTLQRRRPLHPRDARLLNLERLALALLLVLVLVLLLVLVLPPPLPPPLKSPRSFSLSSSHHRAKPHSLLLRHARTQFGVPRPASPPCPGTADRHRRIPA